MKRPQTSAYCCYCKRPLTPGKDQKGTSFTLDHVKARAAGGFRRVPCCHKCNQLKSDMHMEDWFWFIRAFPRWWKRFDTHEQVMVRIQEEYRRRAYANRDRLAKA